MILLRKIPAPKELTANQLRWTARWRRSQPKQWATPSAKKLLQRYLPGKSHNKCVYCESILGASARAEIEHYHAKTVKPELTFEWSNLFLACGYCNSTKLDQQHDGVLLKPDVDNGEMCLWFNADTGELEHLPGTNPARHETTCRLCDLNRPILREERIKQHRLATALLDAIAEQGSLPKKLRLILVRLLAPQAEYKLALRSALPKRLAQVDRRMYHAAD